MTPKKHRNKAREWWFIVCKDEHVDHIGYRSLAWAQDRAKSLDHDRARCAPHKVIKVREVLSKSSGRGGRKKK